MLRFVLKLSLESGLLRESGVDSREALESVLFQGDVLVVAVRPVGSIATAQRTAAA